MLKKTGITLFVILNILCMGDAVADIYMFIDDSGIVHFTNVPTSSDYKLYIREKPEKVLKKISTKKYDNIIKKAQKKYGGFVSFFKSVFNVVICFNNNAVSKKCANGLLQIMPDNFKALSVKDPFDPSQNIMGGTLHLQRLLRRYEYKLPLALAAYNAGTETVDKYKRIPPYKETQNYVRKVMKTYSQYKNS